MKDTEGNAFSITYSGAVNEELEQIKQKYSQKEPDLKIKRIRALDKRVDFISTMTSIFTGLGGTVFAAISIILTVKDYCSLPVGVLLLLTGIIIIAAVPFLHGRIHSSVKSYYSPEILTLIEEIEQNRM